MKLQRPSEHSLKYRTYKRPVRTCWASGGVESTKNSRRSSPIFAEPLDCVSQTSAWSLILQASRFDATVNQHPDAEQSAKEGPDDASCRRRRRSQKKEMSLVHWQRTWPHKSLTQKKETHGSRLTIARRP